MQFALETHRFSSLAVAWRKSQGGFGASHGSIRFYWIVIYRESEWVSSCQTICNVCCCKAEDKPAFPIIIYSLRHVQSCPDFSWCMKHFVGEDGEVATNTLLTLNLQLYVYLNLHSSPKAVFLCEHLLQQRGGGRKLRDCEGKKWTVKVFLLLCCPHLWESCWWEISLEPRCQPSQAQPHSTFWRRGKMKEFL